MPIPHLNEVQRAGDLQGHIAVLLHLGCQRQDVEPVMRLAFAWFGVHPAPENIAVGIDRLDAVRIVYQRALALHGSETLALISAAQDLGLEP